MAAERSRAMVDEVKTLLWLQGKLVLSMFRSRRLHVWAQIGRILLLLLMLGTTLPLFLGMGVLLGLAVARLSAQAAVELLLIVNTVLLLGWMLLPATYSSQLVERFEMSRLFVHPVRFRSLVAGSALLSFLSFTGVWSLPILAGEVAGLAWHSPTSLPLILLGTLPTFAILVLGGRLMDDLLDLVAGDRRLRGLLLFLTSLPFLLLLFGNYFIQAVTQNPALLERYLRPLVGTLPSLEGLRFGQAVDLLLVHVRLSRVLLWLPSGWGTAAMSMVIAGRWLAGLGFLLPALGLCGLLLWVHAAVTRRMMAGATLRIGTERVTSRRWERDLPGPPDFWALLRKDWTYLRRSPITLRTLLATPLVVVALGFGLWQTATLLPAASPLRGWIPQLAATLVVVSANLATSNLTGDYFGAVDREGTVSLVLTPVDRRLVLLSATAVTLGYCLAQCVVLLGLVAVLTRSWSLVPWGLLLAVCLHVGAMPFYHLSSILTPYRAPLGFWTRQGGNMGILLAWVAGAPPVVALFVLPALFWPAGQIVTLPAAVLYALGLYALTLKPIAGLVDRRTQQIVDAVMEEA